ncbi:RrF2 family transcriptional regulator [Rhodovulum strictum]|uniref:Rrf2 family transcriptional regulator n=1 Tax=Rhodovulum strictum TaxID=58314 RepID=A0A844BK44_9RHOB|nr:Rrf2 family transcriptional regulator [Rhodovulum strictum]MRH21382.1 Rrf2 family transcriptional regulator [Rhodovulum strictum]
MITQRTKYALKALMELAEEAAGAGEALTIEQIAQRSGTPKRFLEHILLDLKKAGYLGSKRGRAGGYVLIRTPRQISIGELLREVDGPIAPLSCLSRRAYQPCEDCTDEASCRIRKLFGQVFYAYLLLVESLTLADLVERTDRLDRLLAGVEAAGE